MSLTIISCVTTQKTEIVLPEKPERQKMPEVQTVQDVAKLVNYYEHLVREWELWGATVEEAVKTR